MLLQVPWNCEIVHPGLPDSRNIMNYLASLFEKGFIIIRPVGDCECLVVPRLSVATFQLLGAVFRYGATKRLKRRAFMYCFNRFLHGS
jgi:hypothetical protein